MMTIKKFNDWLALKITSAVGSMWCAYLFAAIALISLPQALASGNVLTIVSWIAQTFLQLVLLAVIQTGQNIIGATQEEHIDKTEQLTEQIRQMSLQIESLLEQVKQEEDEELDDIEKK